MKLKIKKNIKTGIIVISFVFLVTLSLFLYNEIKEPGFIEEDITLYNYTITPSLDYQVFLKPNILYNEECIDEGNVYLTEFIDYININFAYKFIGQEKADITGDYEILGIVEGYTGSDENFKSIWEKKYELVPTKKFSSKGNEIKVQENIAINLVDYNHFAAQVIDDSNTSTNIRLTMVMNVNPKIKTEHGIIDEKTSPSMIIPLRTSYFEIIKSNMDEKQDMIKETKQIELPINKKIVIVYSCLNSIILIILVFILFFTEGIKNTDLFEKELKKIFKNHGSRLVALNDEVAVTHENTYFVKSMDDLVKIADEISQPITYQYSPYLKDMTEFYLFDDMKLYVFNLNQKFQEGNLEYFSDNEEIG